MSENIKPYEKSDAGKKVQVTQMFDNISENYDTMNRVITFGMDLKWRKNMLKIIADQQPDSILDIATGTGDMAIQFTKTTATKIIGLDISTGMLDVAKKKSAKLELNDKLTFEIGDAENLPYSDATFDIATVSYGIRNFENLEKGLLEILRVLKPGGMMVILETSVPAKFPMKQGYLFYSKYILPTIGKLFSKDKKAYGYLSDSAMVFPYGKELQLIFEKLGFKHVAVIPQSGGISTIYTASK